MIYFDIDGVVRDSLSFILDKASELGIDVSEIDISKYGDPIIVELAHTYTPELSLYSLPTKYYNIVFELGKRINEMGDYLTFITKNPCKKETNEWIDTYFGNKGVETDIIYVDDLQLKLDIIEENENNILIEDYPYEHPQIVLIDYPYNRNIDDTKIKYRVKNAIDMLQILNELYKKEYGTNVFEKNT